MGYRENLIARVKEQFPDLVTQQYTGNGFRDTIKGQDEGENEFEALARLSEENPQLKQLLLQSGAGNAQGEIAPLWKTGQAVYQNGKEYLTSGSAPANYWQDDPFLGGILDSEKYTNLVGSGESGLGKFIGNVALPAVLGGGLAGLAASGAGAAGVLGSEAGGTVAGLPESYWGATAGLAPASDAAAAGAGTIGAETGGGLGALGATAGAAGAGEALSGMDLAGDAGNMFSGNGAFASGQGALNAAPGLAQWGTTAATAASPLSNIFNNGGSLDDYLKVGGAIAPGVLGYLGSQNQTDTLKSIYDQQQAIRKPVQDIYMNALQNPDSWYQSAPAQGSVDAILRKLSTQGNPDANPGLLSQAAAYNLGGYNNYLNTVGNQAFGGQSNQTQLGTNIAQAQGGGYDAIGLGLSRLANPQPSLDDTLKKYGLTVGGVKYG